MNNRGQANSVFRLLIYAIIAAVLILLAYNFFIVKPVDASQEIRDGIAYSQANLGKAYTKEVFFPKDFSISAERSLDNSQTNVSFQCLDTTVCGKFLDVTPKRATALKEGISKITTRCDYAFTVFSCRVYFGLPPAQVAIEKSEIPAAINLEKESPVFKVQIRNIGKQTGANVFLGVELYKKELIENEEKELLYSESPSVQFMETLAPNEAKSFSIPLKINDNGDFVLKYRVEGVDSGYQQGKAEFKVTGAQEKQSCIIGNVGETTLSIERNRCETQFICNGCTTASECAYKWQKQEPEGDFTPVTTDFAITSFEPYANGTCVADSTSGNQASAGGQEITQQSQTPSNQGTQQPPQTQPTGTQDTDTQTQQPSQPQQQNNNPPIQGNGWIWPVNLMEVNSCFGARPYLGSGNFHGGIDMPVGKGTPVMAVDNGTAIRTGSENCGTGFGNCVVVQHSNGTYSSYNHLEKALVKVGDNVTKGQVVALSDSTGNSTGDHLHFAVFTSAADVQVGARGKNPMCFFSESVKSTLTFTGINCKAPYPDPKTYGC